MKGLATLIRAQSWRLEEMRRNLGELEGMRADFERRGVELEQELKREQVMVATTEEFGFAYNAYANAVINRRQNLAGSIADVDVEIMKARDKVREAYQELRKFEITEERDLARAQAEEERRERIMLDDIGVELHRRKTG
ncbi:MAG: flagellar FliJ family protein [Alphaproteobacteria bacterium]|nr:flagellar FliJ family protein [Alphaproteobacteria bacterium]|tara:strand:+ start:469 stop:885 length:417 start_codon:yes stop_codon:yes gene_type:complete